MAKCVLTQLQVLLSRNEKNFQAQNKDLYRLLLNPQIYLFIKYQDRELNKLFATERQFLNFFDSIIEDLRCENFKLWKSLEEKNFDGRKKEFVEKAVLEIIQILLNPNFSKLNTNHFGNPKMIVQNWKQTWQEKNWVLQLNFDSQIILFDDSILITLLRKKIQDERFLNLIRRIMKTKNENSGKNDFFYCFSYLIFQNLYFYEIQNFFSIRVPKASILRSDFHLFCGITGTKSFIQIIQTDLETFVKRQFNLPSISNSTKKIFLLSDKIYFRGFLLSNSYLKSSKKGSIWVPIDLILKYLTTQNFCLSTGFPIRKKGWINYSDEKIIKNYNRILEDLFSFYSFTENFKTFFGKIEYILKYSCAHTLAAKHRSKISIQLSRKDLASMSVLFFSRKKIFNLRFDEKRFLHFEKKITQIYRTLY